MSMSKYAVSILLSAIAQAEKEGKKIVISEPKFDYTLEFEKERCNKQISTTGSNGSSMTRNVIKSNLNTK